MDSTAARLAASIPLSVPIPVDGADGKPAHRAALTMNRPKVRHVKRLAALIGQDIVTALMDEGEELAAAIRNPQQAEGRAFVRNLLGKLVQREALDELTAIVADMCGEEQVVIDDLDVVDLVAVGAAFLGFFPALQSLASGASPKT
ncbi:MAG: phage tail assembly protein [Bauldia sp.]|nr:MAG: phage tail assembly protein [Bauldia sp.]MBE0693798.1 hypothetical protein [Aquamicrobium sp.]